MTKYQIFSPNGTPACIVEAESVYPTASRDLCFLNVPYTEPNEKNVLFWLPAGWVAIPISVIVEE
jgi:hypothetical protein